MDDPKPGLEWSEVDEGFVGKDPRNMEVAELNALGHEKRRILSVIREKCLDCVGMLPSEVRKCVSTTCALWPYRQNKNPFFEGREMSDEEKQVVRDRFAAARAAGQASDIDEEDLI